MLLDEPSEEEMTLTTDALKTLTPFDLGQDPLAKTLEKKLMFSPVRRGRGTVDVKKEAEDNYGGFSRFPGFIILLLCLVISWMLVGFSLVLSLRLGRSSQIFILHRSEISCSSSYNT